MPIARSICRELGEPIQILEGVSKSFAVPPKLAAYAAFFKARRPVCVLQCFASAVLRAKTGVPIGVGDRVQQLRLVQAIDQG